MNKYWNDYNFEKQRNGNKVSYVMRVSAVFVTAARCCNIANSSLTIGVKKKI